MSAKLFILGSTGYIGGDAVYEILHAHPEYDVTCLVRNSDKGAKIASQYPKVRLVYGTLDDADLLEVEASKADIVLNFAHADHEGAAKALIKGLASRTNEQPGYVIHTSGTGILTFSDFQSKTFGEPSAKVYDDWDGIEELISLPDDAFHRNVDKIILEGSNEYPKKVRTAIVCPPTIYGKGRGPDNQRSQQLYELAKHTLKLKQGFQVGAGKAYWTQIHVADLSKCYLKLVEAAVAGGGDATWNEKGYYFTENGEFTWGDISKLVAAAAHGQGFIPSEEVAAMSPEQISQIHPFGNVIWGSNSRGRALRARKLFGWSPVEKTLEEEVPEAVHREATSLGLVAGHAAKVAV